MAIKTITYKLKEMKWIKASEEKPEDGKKVFIRWKHHLTKQDEWEVLYDTSRVFGDAKYWELEWLDESESSKDQEISSLNEILKQKMELLVKANEEIERLKGLAESLYLKLIPNSYTETQKQSFLQQFKIENQL